MRRLETAAALPSRPAHPHPDLAPILPQTMASLLGAVPGAEGAAVDVNMGWDEDVDAEVEAENLLRLAQVRGPI